MHRQILFTKVEAPVADNAEGMDKLRVVTDYERLSEEIQEQIKLEYPYGYSQHLILFKNREGKNIKGLRFETEEKIILIRMTENQAEEIVEQDDDFDEDGNLIEDVRDEYEEKYSDGDEVEGEVEVEGEDDED